MIGRKTLMAAGVVSILYIGAQCFQTWVFARVPDGTTPVEMLMSGANQLSIARSSVMLIAIYGLFFIYATVSLSYFDRNKAASTFALLGFVVFLIAEIGLRSVELFYTQIHLPAAYQATQDPAAREAILRSFETFQQVQSALYFPLMFSPFISAVILVMTYPAEQFSWILRNVFAINAVRLALRIAAGYLGWDLLGPKLTDNLYLPLTFIMIGGIAAWAFAKTRARQPA